MAGTYLYQISADRTDPITLPAIQRAYFDTEKFSVSVKDDNYHHYVGQLSRTYSRGKDFYSKHSCTKSTDIVFHNLWSW